MSKTMEFKRAREHGLTHDELQAIIGAAEDNALTKFSIDFVSEMSDKFHKFGVRMFLSDKQLALLKGIGDGTDEDRA